MRLASAVLLTVLLPGAAAASTSSGITTGPACSAGRLATCASVQVQYVRMGSTTAPALTIGSGSAQKITAESTILGFRFQPVLSQLSGSPGGPQILAIALGDDGRPIECRPGGLDCRVADPIATPEPITMTLVATGLFGMASASRLRRRGKKLASV